MPDAEREHAAFFSALPSWFPPPPADRPDSHYAVHNHKRNVSGHNDSSSLLTCTKVFGIQPCPWHLLGSPPPTPCLPVGGTAPVPSKPPSNGSTLVYAPQRAPCTISQFSPLLSTENSYVRYCHLGGVSSPPFHAVGSVTELVHLIAVDGDDAAQIHVPQTALDHHPTLPFQDWDLSYFADDQVDDHLQGVENTLPFRRHRTQAGHTVLLQAAP